MVSAFSPEKMCFEEASRIGIKISFIKIAGVFDRGEIYTGAILAVRIAKRPAAGMELITFIMKKLWSGLVVHHQPKISPRFYNSLDPQDLFGKQIYLINTEETCCSR